MVVHSSLILNHKCESMPKLNLLANRLNWQHDKLESV